MRRSSVALLALLWLAPPAPSADDPRALVEKAVQALGGAALPPHPLAPPARSTGNSLNPGALDGGDTLAFEADLFSCKGRRKMNWKMDGLGAKMEVVQVSDGAKSWISYNGKVQDLSAEMKDYYDQYAYQERVGSLLP